MWQGKVRILANEEVAPNYFKMVLKAPQVAREAKAGQFIHVRVGAGYDPLLRRPLSLHRIDQKRRNIVILYEVAGKGTKILAQKQVGEKLDILGPLGQGFNLPEGMEVAILAAGGIGVAPLLSLAEEIRESGKLKVENMHVLIGARTKGLVFSENDFRNLDAEVRVATDDGSQGHKGLVTTLLKQLLSTVNCQLSTVIYACGPREMLREIATLTINRELPGQLSLENQMGCGVGACQGCVVKTQNPKPKTQNYKRVCKEGPVFEAGEIIWE